MRYSAKNMSRFELERGRAEKLVLTLVAIIYLWVFIRAENVQIWDNILLQEERLKHKKNLSFCITIKWPSSEDKNGVENLCMNDCKWTLFVSDLSVCPLKMTIWFYHRSPIAQVFHFNHACYNYLFSYLYSGLSWALLWCHASPCLAQAYLL